MKLVKRTIVSLVTILMVMGCSTSKKQEKKMKENEYAKGTFGYDYKFLDQYYEDLILLFGKDNQSLVAVSPELQGRIMTSAAKGMSGKSFGWINHDLIASGEILEHINAFGGEERFWIGPEGGQFAYYFPPESEFTAANWQVPKEIDTEPFELVSSNTNSAVFKRSMNLKNYLGNMFNMDVTRTIRLIDSDSAGSILGTTVPDKLSFVGMESINKLQNSGGNTWDKEYGMPSIWILSMLNPSDQTVVILPFRKGDESKLGPIVNDYKFNGKIPDERLIIGENAVFYRADGKFRGKIGISPRRALPVAGSYDSKNKVLTIAQFTVPEGATNYVNSMWELQDEPFSGDVVNSYNDGPFEDGTLMGPFYEIESSSPAANLSPGESLTHVHRTFHFTGTFEDLNTISKKILGVDLAVISTVFD